MTVLRMVVLPCAVAVGVVWAGATLVHALRRRRRDLTIATAVVAGAGALAASAVMLSANVVVILVAGPVALITLSLLLVGLVAVSALSVRQMATGIRLYLRFRQGVARLRAGDAADAEAIFRDVASRATAVPSMHGAALTNLGAALSREGRYAEAREALETSLASRAAADRRPQRQGIVFYNLAWVAFLAQDFAAAQARLRESLATHPGDANLRALTRMLEGRLAGRAGDYTGAEAAFELAARAAAESRNQERVAQVELQRGILEYIQGGRPTGRDRILAVVPGHTTPDGRHLAALWLAGLSAIADGEDRVRFLDAATELEPRDWASEAASASAYIQA